MRFAAASQYFVRCRHAALLSRCSIHAAVRIQRTVPVLPSPVRCASFRALQRRCVSVCVAYNLQQPAVSIYFLSHPLGLSFTSAGVAYLQCAVSPGGTISLVASPAGYPVLVFLLELISLVADATR